MMDYSPQHDAYDTLEANGLHDGVVDLISGWSTDEDILGSINVSKIPPMMENSPQCFAARDADYTFEAIDTDDGRGDRIIGWNTDEDDLGSSNLSRMPPMLQPVSLPGQDGSMVMGYVVMAPVVMHQDMFYQVPLADGCWFGPDGNAPMATSNEKEQPQFSKALKRRKMQRKKKQDRTAKEEEEALKMQGLQAAEAEERQLQEMYVGKCLEDQSETSTMASGEASPVASTPGNAPTTTSNGCWGGLEGNAPTAMFKEQDESAPGPFKAAKSRPLRRVSDPTGESPASGAAAAWMGRRTSRGLAPLPPGMCEAFDEQHPQVPETDVPSIAAEEPRSNNESRKRRQMQKKKKQELTAKEREEEQASKIVEADEEEQQDKATLGPFKAEKSLPPRRASDPTSKSPSRGKVEAWIGRRTSRNFSPLPPGMSEAFEKQHPQVSETDVPSIAAEEPQSNKEKRRQMQKKKKQERTAKEKEEEEALKMKFLQAAEVQEEQQEDREQIKLPKVAWESAATNSQEQCEASPMASSISKGSISTMASSQDAGEDSSVDSTAGDPVNESTCKEDEIALQACSKRLLLTAWMKLKHQYEIEAEDSDDNRASDNGFQRETEQPRTESHMQIKALLVLADSWPDLAANALASVSEHGKLSCAMLKAANDVGLAKHASNCLLSFPERATSSLWEASILSNAAGFGRGMDIENLLDEALVEAQESDKILVRQALGARDYSRSWADASCW